MGIQFHYPKKVQYEKNLRTVVFHQRSELVSGFREFKDNNPGNDASLNLKVWGRATALGHSHHR